MRPMLLLLGLLLAGTAQAHEAKVGSITIEHPWSRPAAGTGAIYMKLVNGGATSDRLLGVLPGPIAQMAEMHTTTMDSSGVARMREVQSVEVPAGGEALLAPSGLHVMLMGLTQPLKEGESFPVTLQFEHAGEVGVVVAVERQSSHGK